MKLSRENLLLEAEQNGFKPEFFEKIIILIDLLDTFWKHPFLKDRIVLKGGAAINLFLFDMPRLSVDIDLNYVGSFDRKIMQSERKQLDRSFQAIFKRKSLSVDRIPVEHAGGKWRMSFPSVLGKRSHIAVDTNFILRVPLWEPKEANSKNLGRYKASKVRILDEHELIAGKLSALFSRGAARDLFDAHKLLSQDGLNQEALRIAFIVYGGFSRKDWRTISVDDLTIDSNDLYNQLLPLLNEQSIQTSQNLYEWAKLLLENCRERLEIVLPFKANELEFLELLLEKGEIRPELLTENEDLKRKISLHPALKWKAVNVRKHKNITSK